MYLGVALFLIVSAIFLAVISKGGHRKQMRDQEFKRLPEVPYSPEAGHRNAMRIITICVVFGFIGGAIMRFSLFKEDFTEEHGIYRTLELGEEEITIILKNQKIVGGMWLSALAVALIAGGSLQRRENIHPRHVASLLILVPGFVIGLFIMAISPDALPQNATQTIIEEISQHYFLIGAAVMIIAIFSSWICWHSGDKKLLSVKHH